MSKELEEIKSIVAIHFGALGFLNPSENEQILKDRDKVLNYLSRFESIDNANPSEALVYIEDLRIENDALIAIKDTTGYDADTQRIYVGRLKDKEKEINTIKQALLKAQEQEKENAEYKRVLEIIKKKRVDIFRFTKLDFTTFNQLQRSCNLEELTQDEFDLLKEVF